MPTSRLQGSYESFQADIEASDSLYVWEDGSLHWQQGRSEETNVLIPVTPAAFFAQLAGYITRHKLSAREPLVVVVEWSEAKENGNGHPFASRHSVIINRYNPGETLRRLRQNAGMSQFQLAARSGVTERTIRLIETGRTRSVRPDTAAALAKALKVGINDLGLPIVGKGEQG